MINRSYFHLLKITITMALCVIFLSSCQHVVERPNQVIHLTLWQGINPPSNRDVFQKLVDKFNSTHTDIQVESIFSGVQLTKILAAVVGNTPPDILSSSPQLIGQFVELGAIVPIENWLDKTHVKSEVSANLFQELRLHGHTWGVPFSTSNIGIFYRHDLFQTAGITEIPRTWAELRQVARKLTLKNGDGGTPAFSDRPPEQYGILLPLGKSEWTVLSWFPFLLSAGGEIVANDQPNLTNPGAVKALEFWEDLIKDGSALLSPLERGYEEDAFLTGRVAMQITGPWTNIGKSKNVDYKVFPIPADVTQSTVTSSGVFYVMKTNPEREKAAFKFLEFVISQEFQTEWSIGTGFLPVNSKSAQSPAYQKYLRQKPWLKVFLDQIPLSRNRPNLLGYNRLSDSLGRAIEATLLGKSSARDALKQAQARIAPFWPSNREQ